MHIILFHRINYFLILYRHYDYYNFNLTVNTIVQPVQGLLTMALEKVFTPPSPQRTINNLKICVNRHRYRAHMKLLYHLYHYYYVTIY